MTPLAQSLSDSTCCNAHLYYDSGLDTLTAYKNGSQSHLQLLAALEKHLPGSLTESNLELSPTREGKDRQTEE